MGTKIEYLDETWNPIAMRCDPVSPGCANCWHIRMCARQAANPILSQDLRLARCGGTFVMQEKTLRQPLHWKKHRTTGVQFMGDLFHEKIHAGWINQVFAVMALCQRQTFCVLTKRIERARDEFARLGRSIEPLQACARSLGYTLQFRSLEGRTCGVVPWPLPHVMLGVTCENQELADKRIPVLLQIPAAVRFVSIEPMLGAVDIAKLLNGYVRKGSGFVGTGKHIDWVVCGPETGPYRRPCGNDWLKDIVEQCHAAGMPVFVKAASLTRHLCLPVITSDIREISAILGYPPEQLRQFPKTK